MYSSIPTLGLFFFIHLPEQETCFVQMDSNGALAPLPHVSSFFHPEASPAEGQCRADPRSDPGGHRLRGRRGGAATVEAAAQGSGRLRAGSGARRASAGGVQGAGLHGTAARARGTDPGTEVGDLWGEPSTWWKEPTL